MSKLLSALIAAVFTVVTYSAVAAEEAAAPAKPAGTPATKSASAAQKKSNPQQAKMKLCNKDAKEKGLKKAERKEFMKSCLKKS
ncbi:MAG: PsiF family protein [Pseudomonadota bacterium]